MIRQLMAACLLPILLGACDDASLELENTNLNVYYQQNVSHYFYHFTFDLINDSDEDVEIIDLYATGESGSEIGDLLSSEIRAKGKMVPEIITHEVTFTNTPQHIVQQATNKLRAFTNQPFFEGNPVERAEITVKSKLFSTKFTAKQKNRLIYASDSFVFGRYVLVTDRKYDDLNLVIVYRGPEGRTTQRVLFNVENEFKMDRRGNVL